MAIERILEIMRGSAEYVRLADALKKAEGALSVFGLGEAQRLHTVSSLYRDLGGSMLFVAPSSAAANRVHEELSHYHEDALLFPPRELPLAVQRSLEAYPVLYLYIDGYHAVFAEILLGAKYLGSKDHALVFIDDTAKPRLYDITYSSKDIPLAQLQPLISYEDELDSCSPQVFGDILRYMKQNYPAASYGLVMESHASGWLPPLTDTSADNQTAWGARKRSSGMPRRSFGIDNNANTMSDTGSCMSINDIRDQIASFGRFDFILFDACFMQNIEVAYQLRNCARYIIGSPAEIPANGAPYDKMLRPIYSDSAYVEGIVQTYYDAYLNDPIYVILLSVIDCSKLESVAKITAPYVQANKQTLLNMSYQNVLNYFNWNRYFTHNFSDYYDMQGIMRTALNDADYDTWSQSFSQIFVKQVHTTYWYSAFNNSTYNRVDSLQYSGVTMHVPLEKYAVRNMWFASAYYDTDWARTVWLGNDAEDTLSTE